MNFSASYAVGAWGSKIKTMFKQYHHDLMESRRHIHDEV
jgi:hypothetical protein